MGCSTTYYDVQLQHLDLKISFEKCWKIMTLNYKIRLVGVRKTKRATNEERQADMVSHQYLNLLGLG